MKGGCHEKRTIRQDTFISERKIDKKYQHLTQVKRETFEIIGKNQTEKILKNKYQRN